MQAKTVKAALIPVTLLPSPSTLRVYLLRGNLEGRGSVETGRYAGKPETIAAIRKGA
jgi:hypothetical protein